MEKVSTEGEGILTASGVGREERNKDDKEGDGDAEAVAKRARLREEVPVVVFGVNGHTREKRLPRHLFQI